METLPLMMPVSTIGTLVENLGGEIVQCNFLIQLGFLNGAEKLKDYPIKALVNY